MIGLLNVSVNFPGDIKALKNISLEVERGEFVFLTGDSGAGKTTLFRLLIREILPTSGQVIVHGRDLSRMRRREVPFLRRSIGVIFQDFRLLNDRTVFENLAFALRVIGVSEKEIRRRVLETLQLVGLEDKMDNYPLQLSGGEQQRVCLARAVINRPPLLVADEPTGNLDPKNGYEVMKTFQEVNLQGTTVIVATHAIELVKRFPFRVVELSQGEVIADSKRGGNRSGI